MLRRATGYAICALALALPAAAQESDDVERRRPTRAEARVIEQILDLQEEIDELLESLPPHLQDTMRERLEQARERRAALERAAAREAERAAAEAAAAERAVEEADDVPASATPPADVPASAAPPPQTPTTCNTLWLFDSDRDGNVSGADRYWRHLYLWRDENGDGEVQDGEVRSAYERDVRSIAVALDRFERKNESVGEIQIGRHVVLDVRGDGFGGITGGGDDGALVVDATRLGRGTGPRLLAGTGETLAGFQVFRRGLRLRDGTGGVVELSCP